jgi:DNA-directed RNA polymerase subunit RPC12/RpoP
MQHYRCPKCGADAYSSASGEKVLCPKCSTPLAGKKAAVSAGG